MVAQLTEYSKLLHHSSPSKLCEWRYMTCTIPRKRAPEEADMPTSNYWPSAPTAVVAQLTELSILLSHGSPSCARGGTSAAAVVLRILGCLELHRRAHQCADACAYSCTDAPTNVSTHGTDGCIDRCSPQLLPRLCQQQHLRLHRLALRQIRGRQHPWPTPDPHELTNPANTSMSADGSMHTKASQNLSEFCSF